MESFSSKRVVLNVTAFILILLSPTKKFSLKVKTTKLSLDSCPTSNFSSDCYGDQSVFMYVVCAGPKNCFVSFGNWLATEHLHISTNLTRKYELTYH